MNFMKYKTLWFGISALLILPGVLALIVWHLQVGIDFTGGSVAEIQFSNSSLADTSRVTQALTDLHLSNLSVQTAGQGSVIIRSETLDQRQHTALTQALTQKIGANKEVSFETVGPTVSKDLTNKAILAVIIASVAIILFIAWAFRSVPRPASGWRFGISAIAALLHDLLFVVGAFAILGHFFHYEVDSLFITALLTVMGFSVHDTIVVFDRIRENLKRSPSTSFSDIANISLAQTLSRSLATSLTVIFVLLAMFLLGGVTIKPFIMALLLGITIGTYSSIFNATPLLVVWQEVVMRRGSQR